MNGFEVLGRVVLSRDDCCGCGTCADICPTGAIKVCFYAYGECRPDRSCVCDKYRLYMKIYSFNLAPRGRSFFNSGANEFRRDTDFFHPCFAG